MREFQVDCPSCRVTFPVETRRCLHCGGRLTRPGQRPRDLPPELDIFEPDEEAEEETQAEVSSPPLTIRRALVMAWLFTAVFGAFFRSCTS